MGKYEQLQRRDVYIMSYSRGNIGNALFAKDSWVRVLVLTIATKLVEFEECSAIDAISG